MILKIDIDKSKVLGVREYQNQRANIEKVKMNGGGLKKMVQFKYLAHKKKK